MKIKNEDEFYIAQAYASIAYASKSTSQKYRCWGVAMEHLRKAYGL